MDEEPEIDVELEPAESCEVDRILKWRRVRVGRRRSREFLVTWVGYPLDEAQWVPEADFDSQAQLQTHLREDRPVEEKTSSS